MAFSLALYLLNSLMQSLGDKSDARGPGACEREREWRGGGGGEIEEVRL